MNAHFRFTSGTIPPTQRQINAALDTFAEHLSNDMPLPAIASTMRITGGSACAFLNMLSKKYGRQAL